MMICVMRLKNIRIILKVPIICLSVRYERESIVWAKKNYNKQCSQRYGCRRAEGNSECPRLLKPENGLPVVVRSIEH